MNKPILLLMMLSIIAPRCVLEQQAPPTPTIVEQEQVALTIMNRLKTNNLRIHKNDNAYVITHDSGDFTVSEGVGRSGPYGSFYSNGDTLEIQLTLVRNSNPQSRPSGQPTPRHTKPIQETRHPIPTAKG